MVGYTRLKLGDKLKLEDVRPFYCEELDFFFDERTSCMYDKYTGVIIHRDTFTNCKNYLRYRLQKDEYMLKLQDFWEKAGSLDDFYKEGKILKKFISLFEKTSKIKLEIEENRSSFFNAKIVNIPEMMPGKLSWYWEEIETRLNKKSIFQWVCVKQPKVIKK